MWHSPNRTALLFVAATMTIFGVLPWPPPTQRAHAQTAPPGQGPGSGPGMMMGRGMMMGPGMMGPAGFGFSCHPRAAGMAEWRLGQIEAAVKPNEAQKVKLEELRAASTKATQIIAAGCATQLPAKAVERLDVMEKRLDSLQQAFKTVRPAFEAFYASLDDTQKAKLDTVGPRRWGWRHWHWRWDR